MHLPRSFVKDFYQTIFLNANINHKTNHKIPKTIIKALDNVRSICYNNHSKTKKELIQMKMSRKDVLTVFDCTFKNKLRTYLCKYDLQRDGVDFVIYARLKLWAKAILFLPIAIIEFFHCVWALGLKEYPDVLVSSFCHPMDVWGIGFPYGGDSPKYNYLKTIYEKNKKTY